MNISLKTASQKESERIPPQYFAGEFCKNHFITHIECPIQDHRENGKVERLIRTINERIRAEKTIITEKGNAGLTRLLFALRTAATANGNSPFENAFGQKPNTIKNILIEKPKNCLEKTTMPYSSHQKTSRKTTTQQF